MTITPYDLARQIERIVAQECKCEVSWAQHGAACTASELMEIYCRVADFIVYWREEAITEELKPHALDCTCMPCREQRRQDYGDEG
jgi:hypothetical protein